jgi:integrase
VARKKKKKKTTRMDIIAEWNLPEPLENLRLRLSSPRLRAPGTIKTYLETAERLIRWIEKEKPTENDLRRYFLRRRQQGISERTLKKEFYHLKKLCQANSWDWPFEKEDVPFSEDASPTVALDIPVIEQLISARKKYTERERFYLAISTTFGNRRVEMANLEKRDISDETILIKTAKHGRPVKHLIPQELKRVFDAYQPKKHQPEALSTMFNIICNKAGVKTEYGWGWHSIRRSLVTCLLGLLPKNNLDPAITADYMGWAKSSLSQFFGGSPMLGLYRRPEILDNDPFGVDKVIYEIHPFLPLWKDEKITTKTTRRNRNEEHALRSNS